MSEYRVWFIIKADDRKLPDKEKAISIMVTVQSGSTPEKEFHARYPRSKYRFVSADEEV